MIYPSSEYLADRLFTTVRTTSYGTTTRIARKDARVLSLDDKLVGMELPNLGKWEIASVLAIAAVAGIMAYSRGGMGGLSLLVNIVLQASLVLIVGVGFFFLLRKIGFYPGIADDYFARRK